MQPPPGFRDYFPADCARRDYLFTRWREVTRRYGFVEYDGPILENLDLYRRKSGGELISQLFDFTDKGGREVTLRPEMTPTLARMVAARDREFRKPLKWYSIAQFFRYEKQQRGRFREFCQLNCDIIGEAGPGADAELTALVIDLLREFGFCEADFQIRMNTRETWAAFATQQGLDEAGQETLLGIVDKFDFARGEAQADAVRTKLAEIGIEAGAIVQFVRDTTQPPERLAALLADLDARGLKNYAVFDPTIVRGLAYYTGFVFEVFDTRRELRAIAGGGRYDQLIAKLSDGAVNHPALGFGMGDAVLMEFLEIVPAVKSRMDAALKASRVADLYFVIASEENRSRALGLVQQAREAGFSTEFPLAIGTKVGKQFQNAEATGARFAVVVGAEWPEVKVKTLATREEEAVAAADLLDTLRALSST